MRHGPSFSSLFVDFTSPTAGACYVCRRRECRSPIRLPAGPAISALSQVLLEDHGMGTRTRVFAGAAKPSADVERRGDSRAPSQRTVQCRSITGPPNVTWPATVWDATAGGIGLLTPVRFEPGMVLAVQFSPGESAAADQAGGGSSCSPATEHRLGRGRFLRPPAEPPASGIPDLTAPEAPQVLRNTSRSRRPDWPADSLLFQMSDLSAGSGPVRPFIIQIAY